MISSCVEYVLCNESFRYLQQKIFLSLEQPLG